MKKILFLLLFFAATFVAQAQTGYIARYEFVTSKGFQSRTQTAMIEIANDSLASPTDSLTLIYARTILQNPNDERIIDRFVFNCLSNPTLNAETTSDSDIKFIVSGIYRQLDLAYRKQIGALRPGEE